MLHHDDGCGDRSCKITVVVEMFQILRDPSGNSFVESFVAPARDPRREVAAFPRSKEEDHALGVFTREEVEEANKEELVVGVGNLSYLIVDDDSD